MLTKARPGAQVKISDADQGQVSVLFAKLKTIDHDNDVTLPGAFTDGQEVRISAWNHGSWNAGLMPVGKGQIHEDGDNAIFDGEFFLNTTAGADTFETVKQMGALQEWSYGYDVLDGAPGEWEGKSVNLLKSLKVFEVSPVLLGAGIGTQTLSAKGLNRPTPPTIACPKCRTTAELLFAADGKVKSAICPDCSHTMRFDSKQLDSDIETQLQDLGNERYGTQAYVCLIDHDDDQGYAIFAIYPNNGDSGDQMVAVAFNRADDGTITLGIGEQQVEQTVSYTPKAAPVAPTKDEPDPSGLKLVDHLALALEKAREVTARLADVKAMRAEKGKELADDTAAKAAELVDGLESAAKALREVVTSADADKPAADGDGLTLEDEAAAAEAASLALLSL